MTLYPTDYRTSMVTMDVLVARHGGRLHPEFHRRLFAWIESMDGLIGIGQTYRAVQPDKPGFAQPGRSFHEIQEFASGLKVVAAVDLVATAAKGNPNPVHRSPTWPESATATIYGLHTFIKGEPWHMQPTDGPSRGWLSWVKAGRPDPAWIPLPSDLQPEPEPEPPITPPQGAPEMFFFVVTNAPQSAVAETWLLCDGTQLSHVVDGNAADVFIAAKTPVVRADPKKGAEQTAGLIKSCRTMNTCPPEWKGTGWENLWVASR